MGSTYPAVENPAKRDLANLVTHQVTGRHILPEGDTLG